MLHVNIPYSREKNTSQDMIPIPEQDHEFCITDEATDLELSPPLKESSGTRFAFCSDQIRYRKRLRRTYSAGESLPFASKHESFCPSGISRSRSTSSLGNLSFRDHIWNYRRYHVVEAVEDAVEAEDNLNAQDSSIEAIRLVHLLISCAESVACRDKSRSATLLSELRLRALVFGTSFQRVASCFVQGLSDRISFLRPLGTAGFSAQYTAKYMEISSEKEEAQALVYEICPHIKFSHFVANKSILEAFEGESFVHVVDLGMGPGLPHGQQWQHLIQMLAACSGAPLQQLRITAIGLCVSKFHLIGQKLEIYAVSMGINLKFSVVESDLENLQPEDITTSEDEVLIINSILQLHCVVKESRGALNSVLQTIHELSPKVLILVEQDSGHNGPFFLGRFMEALHYYSAIFDSLDAMLPKYDTRRAKVEQFYYGEEIKNIVSCEGPARVERHEKVDQWRRKMSRAGFQAAPIKMIAQAKQWLKETKIIEGYTVVEDKGCLLLGWKSKPIIAASCWKC